MRRGNAARRFSMLALFVGPIGCRSPDVSTVAPKNTPPTRVEVSPVDWACPLPVAQIDYPPNLTVPHPPMPESFGEVLASGSALMGGPLEPTLADDVDAHPCTVRAVEEPDGEPDGFREATPGATTVVDTPRTRDGWRVTDHHFVYDQSGRVVLAGASEGQYVYDRDEASRLSVAPTNTQFRPLTSVRRIVRWPDGAILKEATRDDEDITEIHWCRDRRGIPTGAHQAPSLERDKARRNALRFEYDDSGRPVLGHQLWAPTAESLSLYELTWNDRNELVAERSPRFGTSVEYQWSRGRPVKISISGVGTATWSYEANRAVKILYRRTNGQIEGVRRFVNGREIETIAYDEKTGQPRHRLKVEFNSDGRPVKTQTPQETRHQTYDENGREVRRQHVGADGQINATFAFGYAGCRPESELENYFESGV